MTSVPLISVRWNQRSRGLLKTVETNQFLGEEFIVRKQINTFLQIYILRFHVRRIGYFANRKRKLETVDHCRWVIRR